MRHFLRVLKVARAYWAWFVAAMLSMMLVAAATVFAYNLVRPVYDRMLDPDQPADSPIELRERDGLVGELDRLAERGQAVLVSWLGESSAILLVLVILAFGVKNAFSFVARFAMARLGLATVRDLRDQVFRSLLRQSQAYFKTSSTGRLVSRVVSDVQLINEALAERLGDVVQDILTVVVLLAYVLSLDLRLAIATLVIAPLLVAPVLHFSRRLRLRARQAQDRMGDLTMTMDETVRGMRIVQAYGMQDFVQGRFQEATQAHFGARLRARAIQAANAPVMEVIGVAGAMALIAYASSRIGAGSMTLGDFSAFVLGVYGTYNPIKRLNKFNLAVQQADVAAQRIFEIIDAPVQVVDAAGARDLESVGEGVRLNNVSFGYTPGVPVLEGIDLQIPCGRTVALVGPSGAGKSTVAQLILRFWDVDQGSITIDGIDLRELRLSSLRREIGLVTQETVLFNDTVRNNLACGAEGISDEQIRAAVSAAQAEEFIERLPRGYETVVGEGGQLLSGGQRQRIVIARALLRNPPILVLDEATSALDSESERSVQEALDRLVEGRTTLVIAHRLSTVQNADLIVVMDNGHIVEAGTHGELLKQDGHYARLLSRDGSFGKVSE